MKIEVIKNEEIMEVYTPCISPGDRCIFGKSALLSDIELEHPSISRAHAALTCATSTNNNSPYSLTDLNSSYGTWVDGKQLQPGVETEVKHGSLIRFGDSSRVYRVVFSHDGTGKISENLGNNRTAGEHGNNLPGKECRSQVVVASSSLATAGIIPINAVESHKCETIESSVQHDEEVETAGLSGKLPGMDEYDSSDSEPEKSEAAQPQPALALPETSSLKKACTHPSAHDPCVVHSGPHAVQASDELGTNLFSELVVVIFVDISY